MVKKTFYVAVIATLLTGCVNTNEVWAPQSLVPENPQDFEEYSIGQSIVNLKAYKDVFLDGRTPDFKYQDYLKPKNFSEICVDAMDKSDASGESDEEARHKNGQACKKTVLNGGSAKDNIKKIQDYAINRSNYNCAVYLKRLYSSQVNTDFSLNSTSLITSTLATVLTPPSVKAGLSAASAVLTGVQGAKDQSLLQSKVITLILKQIYIMQKDKYQTIQESRNSNSFNWQKAELDAGDYDRLCGIFPALSALEDNVNNATTINRYATILSQYITKRDKLQIQVDVLNSKLINSSLTVEQRKEVKKQRDDKEAEINILDGKINALSVPASYAKPNDDLQKKDNDAAALEKEVVKEVAKEAAEEALDKQAVKDAVKDATQGAAVKKTAQDAVKDAVEEGVAKEVLKEALEAANDNNP